MKSGFVRKTLSIMMIVFLLTGKVMPTVVAKSVSGNELDEVQLVSEIENETEETTEEETTEEVKEDTSEPEIVTEVPDTESDSEEKVSEDESEEKVFKDESLDTGALKPYNLIVERGYSSDRVAGILDDAGVIDNAVAFDRYLCSNGYDKRISVGSYQIPAGADYSTVAKLITNSN